MLSGWPRADALLMGHLNKVFLNVLQSALVLPPCSHGYISEHLCGSFSPKCGELSCFSYVMSSLPTPPQLKCNYHLADTKMRFLACGLSRCYLEFLNFRQARRRKKRPSFFLSCRPTFWGWAGKEERKSYTRKEEVREEEEKERKGGRGMTEKEKWGRVSGRMW